MDSSFQSAMATHSVLWLMVSILVLMDSSFQYSMCADVFDSLQVSILVLMDSSFQSQAMFESLGEMLAFQSLF